MRAAELDTAHRAEAAALQSHRLRERAAEPLGLELSSAKARAAELAAEASTAEASAEAERRAARAASSRLEHTANELHRCRQDADVDAAEFSNKLSECHTKLRALEDANCRLVLQAEQQVWAEQQGVYEQDVSSPLPDRTPLSPRGGAQSTTELVSSLAAATALTEALHQELRHEQAQTEATKKALAARTAELGAARRVMQERIALQCSSQEEGHAEPRGLELASASARVASLEAEVSSVEAIAEAEGRSAKLARGRAERAEEALRRCGQDANTVAADLSDELSDCRAELQALKEANRRFEEHAQSEDQRTSTPPRGQPPRAASGDEIGLEDLDDEEQCIPDAYLLGYTSHR